VRVFLVSFNSILPAAYSGGMNRSLYKFNQRLQIDAQSILIAVSAWITMMNK
jgi:hypothetical protein